MVKYFSCILFPARNQTAGVQVFKTRSQVTHIVRLIKTGSELWLARSVDGLVLCGTRWATNGIRHGNSPICAGNVGLSFADFLLLTVY